MGLTTAEKAGNPNTHFVGRAIDALLIMIVEGTEMLTQLAGDDILFQFLLAVLIISLHNLDNAIDRAVNGFEEHIGKLHLRISFHNRLKAR